MSDAAQDVDGPLDTSSGYVDPADFADGDDIDSAAIIEDTDGFQAPADPDAEPVDEHDGNEPGGDD